MSKPMRCKVRLDSMTDAGAGKKLDLSPVNDGQPENQSFWTATPSGRIELTVTNAAAVAGVKVGAFYFVDFTPAP